MVNMIEKGNVVKQKGNKKQTKTKIEKKVIYKLVNLDLCF